VAAVGDLRFHPFNRHRGEADMTSLKWFARLLVLTASTLAWVGVANAAVSCHKINAKGSGQDLGGGMTQAQIIGGGLLHGTTAGSFAVVGGVPPLLLVNGTVTFTVNGGTLTVQVSGSFDGADPSDAKFVVSGPVISATGKLAGATGTLMIEGDESLTTGKFTEQISGLVCVDLAP
jgi:hypothetical protein